MARQANKDSLNIWLNGIPVGRWTSRRNASSFTYFNEWLAEEQGRPLSLSLPFRPDQAPYAGDLVTNYFDNLLPDSEQIRRRLALRYHTGGTSPFELLKALGRDCAGAVQLLPEDQQPEHLFAIQGKLLTERAIAELLRNLGAPGDWARQDEWNDLRLCIAGAQEKTALLWHDQQWYLPTGSTPTTHILKLPRGRAGTMRADMHTSVENEWLCSWIMQGFQLPVARTAILQFEDQQVLGVERFDRKYSDDGSWIVRLPQEDMCQATGCPPLRKYQSDAGPDMESIMNLLLGSEVAELDRRNFFKAQLIFWLLMAPASDAKNFSIFLLPNGRYRATPLYDILSAHPLVGKGRNRIQTKRIQRRHWSAMAQRVGLGALAAEEIIEEVLDQAPAVAEAMYRLLPSGFRKELADSILQGMLRLCANLQGQARGA